MSVRLRARIQKLGSHGTDFDDDDDHHHQQFLLSLVGHRVSKKLGHLVLSPAILTSLQLFPFSNASLWTDLSHVCFGLPLPLFPCGFQSKACQWLYFLFSMYVPSNSISVSLSVWISRLRILMKLNI